MTDIEQHIRDNEPVSRSELREEFGRDGLKRLSRLLDACVVFEGEDEEYWHIDASDPEDDDAETGWECENCDATLPTTGYVHVDVLDRTVWVNDPGRTHQRRPGEPIHSVRVCDHDCRAEWWRESRWSGDREIGWCSMDTRGETHE